MSEIQQKIEIINSKLLGNEFSLKTEEGKQLYLKLNSLADQFMERDDKENKIKREKKVLILEMADIYEQLHEKGEFLLPITSICSHVYLFVRRKGYDISQSYVYDVIKKNAPQFLNEKIDDLTKDLRKKDSNWCQTFRSEQIDTQILNQKIKDAIQLLENTSPSDIDNSIIQEHLSTLDIEVVAKWKDYSDKMGINTIKFNENEAFFDSKDVDPFREIIRTDKPEYRENEFGDQLINLGDSYVELGKVIRRTGENANQFPLDKGDSRITKFAKKIQNTANFNRLLVAFFKPFTDLKFKRSLLEWCDDIEKAERDHGVHAASSKNPGEGWIRDPNTGQIITVKRNLTREHIDDKIPQIRKIKSMFRQYLPDFLDIHEWYLEKMKNFSIGESYKLSSKLSDRKFK